MRCKICGDYFQSENELQTICGEHTRAETPSPRTDLDILVDRLRVKTPASSQFQPLMDEAADAIEALRCTSEAKP